MTESGAAAPAHKELVSLTDTTVTLAVPVPVPDQELEPAGPLPRSIRRFRTFCAAQRPLAAGAGRVFGPPLGGVCALRGTPDPAKMDPDPPGGPAAEGRGLNPRPPRGPPPLRPECPARLGISA